MAKAPRNKVVSRADWMAARKALLAKEKAYTRERDKLSAARRSLPWEAVTKEYVFEGPDGRQTLPELFAGRTASTGRSSISLTAM